MTKKLISLLVAAMMVLSLIPAAAFASEAAREPAPAKPKVAIASWDFEVNPTENGWIFEDADGDGYNWNWDSNIYQSGSHSIMSASYVNGARTPDNWAISPEFAVPNGGVRITFFVRNYIVHYPETFSVYLIPNGGEPVEIASNQVVYGTNWGEVNYDTNECGGMNAKLAIRHHNCTDQYRFYIDDVSVSFTPDPNVIYEADVSGFPSKLVAGMDPAEMSFSVPEGAEYEIADVTLNDANGNTVPASELTAGETYLISASLRPAEGKSFDPNAVLTANGGAMATDSEWTNIIDGVATISVRYECMTEPVVGFYFETDPVEEGWQFVDSDGDNNNWYWLAWGVNYGTNLDNNAYEGIGHLTSASYYGGALTPDNWAISPEFEVPAVDASVSMYIRAQDSYWSNEHFAVYIGSGTDVSAYTMISEELVSPEAYTKFEFDLSNYAGETVSIAIRHFNSTNQYRINLDCVEVFGSNEEDTPPESYLIHAVQVLDFVEPVWGESPDYTVTIPEDAHYSVASTAWSYITDRPTLMTPDMVFDNPACSYRMTIVIVADEGYTFDISAGGWCDIIIDSYSGSQFNSATQVTIYTGYFTVSEPAPEPIVIDTVEILDFVEPVWGESPDYTVTIPEDAHYSVESATWRYYSVQGGIGYWSDMTSDMVFDNPEYSYRLTIVLVADEGYTFNPSANVIIDSYSGRQALSPTQFKIFTGEFTVSEPAPEPIIIDTVEILGFVEPVWGANPFFGETVPEDAPYSIDYSEWYWQEGANSDMLTETDTFNNPNCLYKRYFRLVPAEGYVFAEVLTITINGETTLVDADFTDNSPDLLAISTIGFTVEEPEPIIIDTVEILGFVEPVWGANPFSGETVPEDAPYSIDYSEWYWQDDANSDMLTETDTFNNPNCLYKRYFRLVPAEGYAFAEVLTITINGETTLVDADFTDNSPDLLAISTIGFTVEEPEPIVIDTVEILGFVEPVWGEAPFYGVTVPEGAHYSITYTDWNWELGLDGDVLAEGDLFNNPDYGYFMFFVIIPEEGYVFSEDVVVMVNGNEEYVGPLSIEREEIVFATIDFFVTEPVPAILGDVDMDGDVDSADALLLLRYIMGLVDLNEDQLAQAEVNGDGEVTITDSLLILRFSMEVIDSFPVEELQ